MTRLRHCKNVISVLLRFLACAPLAAAFVAPLTQLTQQSAAPITQLWMAKKASKRKKAKASTTGGGFGAVTTSSSPKSKGSSDDYAIFPALEPGVKETLVTSSHDGETDPADELPNEIYQRLAQIYGFKQFNYEQQDVNDDEDAASGFSVQDLISGSLDEEVDGEDDEFQISKLPPFEKFHVLHVDPLVIGIDDFFTPQESALYVDMPSSAAGKDMFQTGSMTVGKDAKSKAQRTSTTWFSHYKNAPALMAKASRLLGLDGIDQWEEPQTVRYRRSEKFTWHLDALGPGELTSSKGGQRIATLLVYHTDLEEGEGGATVFRDLRDKDGNRLKVRPKQGSALLFFPAAGGIANTPLDIRTLHCGESVSESSEHDKWISQLWLRQTPNTYEPTAPQGNTHAAAVDAISEYCTSHAS